ncbi:hypothetical protein T492DRAFT_860877 [Pavlovales sp. CCMP2436]|nr:hypothetical protein T492DRAFT_860877 [Pavlovales sp. CCMP2436]
MAPPPPALEIAEALSALQAAATWAAEPPWTPGGRLLALAAVVTVLCVRFGSSNVLRGPLLVFFSTLIAADLIICWSSLAQQAACWTPLWVWVVGYKRRDRRMRPSTYAEWLEVGSSLDRLEGLGDNAFGELETLLLPTLVKNYAGTMAAELYSKTHVGTKDAIAEYFDEHNW